MGFADFLSDAGLTSEPCLLFLQWPSEANMLQSAQQLADHPKLYHWVGGRYTPHPIALYFT